jgi:hypothetical protein
MGGNAFPDLSKRINCAEFDEISRSLLNLFSQNGISSWIIQSFEEKRSFGDIDIIVDDSILKRLKAEDFQNLLGSPVKLLNSNVWSFLYQGVQIDLIFTPANEIEFSLFYFSFNDLGNLIGRLYHKMGLKFGHKGLFYIVRHGNYPFGEICLSRNPKKTIDFLGLSWYRYQQGFKNLEEIFRFVASSKFFNPDIYLFDNLNHQSRTRDRKRPTYNAFLQWCKTQQGLQHFPFPENKDVWFDIFESSFGNFLSELEFYKKEIEKIERFKAIFNGKIVSEITGLQGKELGDFMAKYRANQDKDEFVEFVLKVGPVSIRDSIKKFYEREFAPKPRYDFFSETINTPLNVDYIKLTKFIEELPNYNYNYNKYNE